MHALNGQSRVHQRSEVEYWSVVATDMQFLTLDIKVVYAVK